jgi:hypothetical protein
MGKGGGDIGPSFNHYGQLLQFSLVAIVLCVVGCFLPIYITAGVDIIACLLANHLHGPPKRYDRWPNFTDHYKNWSRINTAVSFAISAFVHYKRS